MGGGMRARAARRGGLPLVGLALAALGRIEEASAALAAASAADPGIWSTLRAPIASLDPFAGEAPDARAVYLLLGQQRLARCDWRDYDAFVARYRELVTRGGVGASYSTFVSTSARVVPWNGGRPVTMAYSVAPRL